MVNTDETHGLVVRRGLPSDIGVLTNLYNYYIDQTPATFDVLPYSVAEREAWFEHFSATGRHQIFVATLDEQLIGYASSSQLRVKAAYDTSIETSVYLAHDCQTPGVGSLLYKALFDSLETEDVHRAYAGITVPNERSIGLHQKFGFKHIGTYQEVGRKFDRYWDVQWFEKAL